MLAHEKGGIGMEKQSDSNTSNFDAAFNYNRHIKEKLIQWKKEFEDAVGSDLNYTAIAKKMETNFGIRTSPQKISAMFDILSDREVKLQEIMALSQIFHFPLEDICEYPNAPISNALEIASLLKHKKENHGITPVSNMFYSGDYYCYYFKPKHVDNLKPVEDSAIEEAKLTINIEKGHSSIILQECRASSTFYGDPLPSFTLKGNLYHFANPNISYSFITSDDGRRAMALMFSYLNLSSDIRYYMSAGMMTFSWDEIHHPLFQKMAIFRVQQDYQDPAVNRHLRGILALNTMPLVIDEETLDRLTEEEPMLKRLISREQAIKKCYVFSESGIQGNSFFIPDEHKRMELLLHLRENSLLPAHELIEEPRTFADYIKCYQQTQLAEKKSPDKP